MAFPQHNLLKIKLNWKKEHLLLNLSFRSANILAIIVLCAGDLCSYRTGGQGSKHGPYQTRSSPSKCHLLLECFYLLDEHQVSLTSWPFTLLR